MKKEAQIFADCFNRKLQGQGWGESMLSDCLIVQKGTTRKYVAFEDLTYALQYGLNVQETSARKLRQDLVAKLLTLDFTVPGFRVEKLEPHPTLVAN